MPEPIRALLSQLPSWSYLDVGLGAGAVLLLLISEVLAPALRWPSYSLLHRLVQVLRAAGFPLTALVARALHRPAPAWHPLRLRGLQRRVVDLEQEITRLRGLAGERRDQRALRSLLREELRALQADPPGAAEAALLIGDLEDLAGDMIAAVRSWRGEVPETAPPAVEADGAPATTEAPPAEPEGVRRFGGRVRKP